VSTIVLAGVGLTLGGNRILESIDLTVEHGEWIGLIGPNGAGKTSLLNGIAGSLPIEGEVRVGGRLVTSLKDRERARVFAVVPQAPVTPPGILAIDYVMLGRTPHIGYFQREGSHDVNVVEAAMANLEIASLAGRRLETLSGGELQRVVLARALAQEAPILLLDEPTSALDVGHRVGALERVELLRRDRNLTVITVLHDLTLAAQFCDRLALMAGGRVADIGQAGAVLTEGAMRKHYGADVVVMDGPGGSVVVVPMRSSRSRLAPSRLIGSSDSAE
jgi:iron complex transport system ATP-binding protein